MERGNRKDSNCFEFFSISFWSGFTSDQISRSVVSDSLWPCAVQPQASLSLPSPGLKMEILWVPSVWGLEFTAWLGHKGCSEVTYFIPQPLDQAVLSPAQQDMAKSSQSCWRSFSHSSAQPSLSSTQTLWCKWLRQKGQRICYPPAYLFLFQRITYVPVFTSTYGIYVCCIILRING